MDLTTPRLRLRPLAPDEMRELLEGRPLPGQTWAEGYPLDGTLVAVAMQQELVDADIDRGGFCHYQVMLADEDVVIGDVGFHAPPDELGEVSVGFGIVPVARRRGYAVEALQAVLAWALARSEVRSVHADTDLVNLASQRVLLGAGMQVVADEGDRKVYEISRRP
ncbi:GNAT family N-acetyltransferase [Conexibacter woesei]|uniref:GNAT family N-acetyltransferase n=1 Tax=Conexibacter woesei TaxID=191495 RepID=UPI00040BF9A7|nr:GNAT family N-acetyltransferase [Conexibacter woesei]